MKCMRGAKLNNQNYLDGKRLQVCARLVNRRNVMGWGECVKAIRGGGGRDLKQCYVEYLYHKLQVELDLCV